MLYSAGSIWGSDNWHDIHNKLNTLQLLPSVCIDIYILIQDRSANSPMLTMLAMAFIQVHHIETYFIESEEYS
jgi:hypothetical protein